MEKTFGLIQRDTREFAYRFITIYLVFERQVSVSLSQKKSKEKKHIFSRIERKVKFFQFFPHVYQSSRFFTEHHPISSFNLWPLRLYR